VLKNPRLRSAAQVCVGASDAPVHRDAAETRPTRGFDSRYQPYRHPAGQPIVAGSAYQWVAPLSFAPAKWTAPGDVRRVLPRAIL
jgi:hypothetical protein